jgi:hypothetical protein
MAQVDSAKTPTKLQETDHPVSAEPVLIRSVPFKYYIHDSVATLRFQLVGDLRREHIAELSGSLETARTTLVDRRLQLDLCLLSSADEKGQAWLLAIRNAGADILPADYFHPSVNPLDQGLRKTPAKLTLGLFLRALGFARREPFAKKCG